MGNKNRDRPKHVQTDKPEAPPWYVALTCTEDGEAALYVSDWHGFAAAAVSRGADAAGACKLADTLMAEMLVRKHVLEHGLPAPSLEDVATEGDPEGEGAAAAAAG